MGVVALKIDVDTREGMRRGVPRLLDLLGRHEIPATFFLAFGPDNSGKALWNLFRPGFLRKMLRTGAPSLYGPRTILSGTLLPARPTAAAFPEIVRRIDAEGHEVGVHAWDHRRWQDHVWHMDPSEVRRHHTRAREAFVAALGREPRAFAAPAWAVTAVSLAAQDEMGLLYASDLRGGGPCRLFAGERVFTTPQIPTTARCIEEILAAGGKKDPDSLAEALVEDATRQDPCVLPLHAEVEGGPYLDWLDGVLCRITEGGARFQTLASIASGLDPAALPLLELALTRLPGRWSPVATGRGASSRSS